MGWHVYLAALVQQRQLVSRWCCRWTCITLLCNGDANNTCWTLLCCSWVSTMTLHFCALRIPVAAAAAAAAARRGQLKALVDIHAADEGLGGPLLADEIKVMVGALDLTHKTAAT